MKHIKTPIEGAYRGVLPLVLESAKPGLKVDLQWDDVAQASLDSFPASDPPSWIARGPRPVSAVD